MAGNVTAPFDKVALSPQALLAGLKFRGLLVTDDVMALKYITYVGHFRLKGYWHPLLDGPTGRFSANTSFEHIVNRYECDREIRCTVLKSIGRLEVAVRTTICNYLSLKYSPHWYLDFSIFSPSRKFGIGQMLSKIEHEVERSRSKEFVASYYRRYETPYLPPGWAMSECVTLGMWSRLFSILRDPADKKAISTKFGISQVEVFESWLHTITVVRNMAAHHDRFLGARLGVSPTNLKVKKIRFSDNRTVYAALTVIHVLLESIRFDGEFKQQMMSLEVKFGAALFRVLGFPEDWQTTAAGW